jgi:hypothetical protein
MQQLFHALDNVKLGIGVIEGLMASAGAGLNLNVDKGMARVGPTDASVAALADKAAAGMNAPGTELEYAGGAIALPASKTSLVWLRSNGTLAVSNDVAAGQSLADVAPELTPDPNKGVMVSGTNVSQKGVLRQPQAASVLLARVVTGAAAISSVSNLVRTKVLIGY